MTGLVPTEEMLGDLGDVEIAEHEIRTVLSGRFRDQAALFGFLHRLRAFGLEVVEVRRLTTLGGSARDATVTIAGEEPTDEPGSGT